MKGREGLPQWFLDWPELLPGEEFYVRSFWDLSTERPVSQGVIGRIPWSKAMDYAVRHGVEPDMLATFWRVIFGMDTGYLDQQRGEYNRSMSAAQREASRQSKSKRDYGR